jgi:multiple antibiotic resistance protein
LGPQLHRLLGKNGLIACERLMAMVLVMLAIQRFMEGVQEFLQKT